MGWTCSTFGEMRNSHKILFHVADVWIMKTCSVVDDYRRFRKRKYEISIFCSRLQKHSSCISSLKIGTIFSSETLVSAYQTKRCYKPWRPQNESSVKHITYNNNNNNNSGYIVVPRNKLQITSLIWRSLSQYSDGLHGGRPRDWFPTGAKIFSTP